MQYKPMKNSKRKHYKKFLSIPFVIIFTIHDILIVGGIFAELQICGEGEGIGEEEGRGVCYSLSTLEKLPSEVIREEYTWMWGDKTKAREEIIEEFKFMGHFEPLTLEQAKVICDTLEEYLAKYPFLRKKWCGRGLYKKYHTRENVYVVRLIAVPDLGIHIASFRMARSSRPLV